LLWEEISCKKRNQIYHEAKLLLRSEIAKINMEGKKD